MKFLALALCLMLATGSNAFLLSDLQALGDKLSTAFQNTLNTLRPTAETLGTQLLNALKTTGSQLASQGLQSLMFGALNVLHGTSTPQPAKKDLLGSLAQAFQTAQNGFQGLLTHEVDGLQGIFSGALGKLQELAHLVPHLGGEQLVHFGQAVDQVVAQHNTGADNFLQHLVDGLKAQVASALHLNKRALPVEFDHLANSLLQGLTPKVDELKQVVSRFGELLKQSVEQLAVHFVTHASSLESNFHGVLSQLAPLLQGEH